MADDKEIGAVTGGGRSSSLRLSLFGANAVLRPGEAVVTYASVGNRPEVQGVPVGTVVSVRGTAGSLTQTALVRSFVDFSALGVVGVVVQVPRHASRISVLPRPAPTVTVTVTATPGVTPSATVTPGASPTASPTGTH
jgi:rod shape-determining protein MreC